MMDPKHVAYGALSGILNQHPIKPAQGAAKARPALATLIGCLFVPWLIFAITFWVRSFEFRQESDGLATVCCYCLLVPVFIFAWMTSNLPNSGDARPLAFLTMTSLLAWLGAFFVGDWNYHRFMKPFYDIRSLNVYPSVDPSKYVGAQLMDAGMVQFAKGSTLLLEKSMGFKDEDIYCVAPIVSASNVSQKNVDFWAIGLNCCSGHRPDFHCGEYSNPQATWGLRLMDDTKRDMYRLAVQQAEVTFNLHSPSPVLLYWMSDPSAEVSAYEDDGFKYFTMSMFAFFSIQLFLVVCVLGILIKM